MKLNIRTVYEVDNKKYTAETSYTVHGDREIENAINIHEAKCGAIERSKLMGVEEIADCHSSEEDGCEHCQKIGKVI